MENQLAFQCDIQPHGFNVYAKASMNFIDFFSWILVVIEIWWWCRVAKTPHQQKNYMKS